MAEELRDDINEALVAMLKEMMKKIKEMSEKHKETLDKMLDENKLKLNDLFKENKDLIKTLNDRLEENNKDFKTFFNEKVYDTMNDYSKRYDRYHDLMMEEIKRLKETLDLSDPNNLKTLENLNKIEKVLLEGKLNKNNILSELDRMKEDIEHEYSDENNKGTKKETVLDDIAEGNSKGDKILDYSRELELEME